MIRKRRRLNESDYQTFKSAIQRVADGKFKKFYKQVKTDKFQEEINVSPAFLIKSVIDMIEEIAEEDEFKIKLEDISEGNRAGDIQLIYSMEYYPDEYVDKANYEWDENKHKWVDDSGNIINEKEMKQFTKEIAEDFLDEIIGYHTDDLDQDYSFRILSKNCKYEYDYQKDRIEFTILVEFFDSPRP